MTPGIQLWQSLTHRPIVRNNCAAKKKGKKKKVNVCKLQLKKMLIVLVPSWAPLRFSLKWLMLTPELIQVRSRIFFLSYLYYLCCLLLFHMSLSLLSSSSSFAFLLTTCVQDTKINTIVCERNWYNSRFKESIFYWTTGAESSRCVKVILMQVIYTNISWLLLPVVNQNKLWFANPDLIW